MNSRYGCINPIRSPRPFEDLWGLPRPDVKHGIGGDPFIRIRTRPFERDPWW